MACRETLRRRAASAWLTHSAGSIGDDEKWVDFVNVFLGIIDEIGCYQLTAYPPNDQDRRRTTT